MYANRLTRMFYQLPSLVAFETDKKLDGRRNCIDACVYEHIQCRLSVKWDP